MRKITTFTLSLFLVATTLFGQGRLNYEKDSRWFWGLNLGTTWQSTDIKNKNDFGWGLTIGKAFNYDYGRKISFDIRGRYLYGEWLGQNVTFTDTVQGLPTSLSGGNTDYATTYGGSVLNYSTRVHRFALELVLHANGVRERTGWDPYIFGGAGLTFFQTRTNALNEFGTMYDYSSLDVINTSTLATFTDGEFESYGDGSQTGGFNVGFMPSLGIGLGYQVAPRFSLGIEHKTTFTRLDYFDGYNASLGIRQNDLYHYTSFYLKFHVKAREKKPVDNTNTLNKIPDYDTQTNVQNQNQPPVVTFTNPSVSGTTVTQPNYTIRADVRFVDNRNNIMFRQNGNYNGSFTFNPSTGKLESNVVLVPGQNVFELSGTNAFGTDSKTTIIIYQRENPTPPVVIITNPSASPQQVSSPGFNFTGTVLNVQTQNQVTLTLNGQNISNFTFNNTNGGVTSMLNLNVGSNIVTLTGTNNAGTDSKTVTIIYSPLQTEQPPVVYFVDPHFTPYTTTASTFLINAEVLNVAGRQNIIFKQNGSVNQNFSYDAFSDDFQSSVVLNPGQNVFEIIATNAAGSAQATTIIIYERQAPKPPVVTITNPSVSPYSTENSVFVLTSTVLNVTTASQIQVTLNGQNLSNFNYVNATNSVTATLNLIEGSNVITVKGTNNDGTDMKQTVIVYRKPVTIQPPVVTFTAPSVDPFTTNVESYTIVATVLNVPTKPGVNVNVNGQNVSTFSYNQGQVIFPITLLEGNNIIVITGTNEAGTASESQTILYRKPQTIVPPIVTFINPNVNPLVVYNQDYNVRARVENVAGSQNITLKINGVVTSNFTYSVSSQYMDFGTALSPGANIIEITGTNAAGQDVATTTIIFRQATPQNPPVVTITTPALNPSTVSTATTPIVATVLNVASAQNIQVVLNGSNITNFTYDVNSKQLNFVANLNLGTNTVQISASNSAGQASDNRVINYKEQVVILPPFVTFINPSEPGKIVTNPSFTMKAKVTNITAANQLTVTMNGMLVNPSLWSYNPTTTEITMNAGLNVGNNGFIITATNNAGTHTASMNVIYRPAILECKKPEITFINPTSATSSSTTASYQLKFAVENVSSAQDLQILINGVSTNTVEYNAATKSVSQIITLAVGQNIIEVIATNSCGEVKTNRIITFKQVEAPCEQPSLQRIVPANETMTIEMPTTVVRASAVNITNAGQLKLFVNGVEKQFTYDAASRIINATVELNNGSNSIKLTANNNCGTAELSWSVMRRACQNPVVTITNTSATNNATVFAEAFTLSAGISQVAASNQITVTQNGNPINFVYDVNTRILSLDRPLVMGNNVFTITATNTCGSDVKKHTVIRKANPNAVPPKINIVNPATTPFITTEGAINVVISTQYVTAANQVSVTVNGTATNFNFNPANGEISFNRTLSVGNNTIVATAVTQYGTASSTKVVVYNKQTIAKPEIVLQSPTGCPAILPVGTNVIRGYITNISDLNQATFKMNGRPIGNYNPVLSNGRLNFTITLSLGSGSNAQNIQISATNEGGSDSKSCEITVQKTEDVRPGNNQGGDGKTEQKPTGTDKKPAGTGTKPKGIETKPAGTGTKPTGTGTKPTGTEVKPAGTGKGTTNPTPTGRGGGN